jgi:hypothetical protein
LVPALDDICCLFLLLVVVVGSDQNERYCDGVGIGFSAEISSLRVTVMVS